MAELVHHVANSDCTARGRCCLRLRRDDAFIEVFLDEKNRTLEVKHSASEAPKLICGYRSKFDLTRLEFYSLDETFNPVPDLSDDANDPEMPISAEQACEMALRDFLFDPPPALFRLDRMPRRSEG